MSETVWRLTQLDELGLDRNHPSLREALTFLKMSQHPCGAWKEHESLREVLPPWAAPGLPAATIYL
ncbi:MAG: squalene--hopene cyclase, partial [Bacillota bacterium]